MSGDTDRANRSADVVARTVNRASEPFRASSSMFAGCCGARRRSRNTYDEETHLETTFLLLGKHRLSPLSMKTKHEAMLCFQGIGESGKSTIVKQTKILFRENGYTREECLRFKPIVFSNPIQSMSTILHAMYRLQIAFDNPILQVGVPTKDQGRTNVSSFDRNVLFRKRRSSFSRILTMRRCPLMSVKRCRPCGATMPFKRASYAFETIN